jgi:hypothetical protein
VKRDQNKYFLPGSCRYNKVPHERSCETAE